MPTRATSASVAAIAFLAACTTPPGPATTANLDHRSPSTAISASGDFPLLRTSAAPFTVNPGRTDPYRRYTFRVRMDGRIVTGVHAISPLRMKTEPITYREGTSTGSVRYAPGLLSYDEITLKRGVTHASEFREWASQVGTFGERRNLARYLKDIRIELMNQGGQLVHAWNLYRCWPSEYVAISGMNALADELAEESLTLRCDGWEKDLDVREPSER